MTQRGREETLQADRCEFISPLRYIVQPDLVQCLISSLMQNAGMIAGMMQKVNPFKSAQPKVRDVTWWSCCCSVLIIIIFLLTFLMWCLQDSHPLHNELSYSDGSLSDNNNQPEKQVHLLWNSNFYWKSGFSFETRPHGLQTFNNFTTKLYFTPFCKKNNK